MRQYFWLKILLCLALIGALFLVGLIGVPIFKEIDSIFDVIKKGSLITVDNGISVLAKVGAAKREYEKKILPFILEHLETCRPKEVAQHSERSMAMANSENKQEFQRVLEKRLPDLTPPQLARVKKVLKVLNGL